VEKEFDDPVNWYKLRLNIAELIEDAIRNTPWIGKLFGGQTPWRIFDKDNYVLGDLEVAFIFAALQEQDPYVWYEIKRGAANEYYMVDGKKVPKRQGNKIREDPRSLHGRLQPSQDVYVVSRPT